MRQGILPLVPGAGRILTPPHTGKGSSAGTPDLSGSATSRTGRCRINPAFRWWCRDALPGAQPGRIFPTAKSSGDAKSSVRSAMFIVSNKQRTERGQPCPRESGFAPKHADKAVRAPPFPVHGSSLSVLRIMRWTRSDSFPVVVVRVLDLGSLFHIHPLMLPDIKAAHYKRLSVCHRAQKRPCRIHAHPERRGERWRRTASARICKQVPPAAIRSTEKLAPGIIRTPPDAVSRTQWFSSPGSPPAERGDNRAPPAPRRDSGAPATRIRNPVVLVLECRRSQWPC